MINTLLALHIIGALFSVIAAINLGSIVFRNKKANSLLRKIRSKNTLLLSALSPTLVSGFALFFLQPEVSNPQKMIIKLTFVFTLTALSAGLHLFLASKKKTTEKI